MPYRDTLGVTGDRNYASPLNKKPMPNFKSRGWAEISKTRSKKNPFKVTYKSKTGETLSTSEPLATRNNCTKNIVAIGKAWEGNSINVLDKSVKLPMWYELSIDGEMVTAGGG